jgi:hypothetical protein
MCEKVIYLKINQYFHDTSIPNKVYYVIGKDLVPMTNNSSTIYYIKLTVMDFETEETTTLTYHPNWEVILASFESKYYLFSKLGENIDDKSYLVLYDDKMNLRSDLYINNQCMITELHNLLKINPNPKRVNVKVDKVIVQKYYGDVNNSINFNQQEFNIEKITNISQIV